MALNNYGILTQYECIEKIINFKDHYYKTLFYYSFYNRFKEIKIFGIECRKDSTSYSAYENELIILFNISANEMKKLLKYIFKYDEEGSKY